jgi:hypothetical protein
MDFIIGLLPITYKGVKVDSILIIINRYTKFSKFFLVSITIIAIKLTELYYNTIDL